MPATLNHNLTFQYCTSCICHVNTDVCECCHSLFTWHSTFSGEAQEYRERYNCRQCGSLVCGPCSMQRHAVPRIGLLAPQRLCDTCFFKGDYAHM